MKTVLEITINEDGTLLYCKDRLTQLKKRRSDINDRLKFITHIVDIYTFYENEEEKHIHDRAYNIMLKLKHDKTDCNMNIDVINDMVSEYIMSQI